MKYIEEQICYKIVRDTSVGLDERLDIINRAVAQGSAGQCISLSGTYMQTHYLPERKTRGKLQETKGSNPWDW